MELTIKEYANQYGANKGTIYKRVKKLQELHPDAEITKQAGNVLYITPTGKRLLDEDLKKRPITQAEESNRLVKLLEEEVTILRDELEYKNRLIEKLVTSLDREQENNKRLLEALESGITQSNTLVKREQDIRALEEIKKPRKPGLIDLVSIFISKRVKK